MTETIIKMTFATLYMFGFLALAFGMLIGAARAKSTNPCCNMICFGALFLAAQFRCWYFVRDSSSGVDYRNIVLCICLCFTMTATAIIIRNHRIVKRHNSINNKNNRQTQG